MILVGLLVRGKFVFPLMPQYCPTSHVKAHTSICQGTLLLVSRKNQVAWNMVMNVLKE